MTSLSRYPAVVGFDQAEAFQQIVGNQMQIIKVP
jgi:hypothetical protein